ncbi:MAG: putative porin [Candidatus Omnitrophica bacterium]|nr:putative porin [Candidatus Omnitrophota bacterium]
MGKRKPLFWFMMLSIGAVAQMALAASEVDILLDKLVDKGILSNVEAGLIRREIAETKESRNKQLAKEIVPESARNWKWKGDIRLRDEFRNRTGTGTDAHRQRIRFRYGLEGKVSDQLKVTARLATGNTSDPISTNQSFDTFFTKKTIVLDLANLEYMPEVPGISKVALVGGIMENPLWTVSPMVWDGDLSWDGGAFKVSQGAGPATFFANGGLFSLDTDETESAALWVAQGGASFQPFSDAEDEFLKNLKLTGALAYHDYRNVANSSKAGTDPITREADNTSATKDFNQLNPSIELASMVAGYPLSFFGDWVHNTSTSSEDNDGFAVGLKLGKAKTPWSFKDGWEAGYFFERLEADAAFDEFVDSDFGGGGTNRRGNAVWLTLATLKNSTLGAKYFFKQNSLRGAKANEERIQLDWVTKF